MDRWAGLLEELGPVVRFDYPYQREGRRRPDRPEVLLAAHREALKKARKGRRRPVVLVGKSMGGRIGCRVAAVEDVEAVVCLGYPLRSPAGTIRDAPLLELPVPAIFVQGTRDPLCPLPKLRSVLRGMTAPWTLHVVRGGDHSLELGRRELRARGLTQEELDRAAVEVIAAALKLG